MHQSKRLDVREVLHFFRYRCQHVHHDQPIILIDILQVLDELAPGFDGQLECSSENPRANLRFHLIDEQTSTDFRQNHHELVIVKSRVIRFNVRLNQLDILRFHRTIQIDLHRLLARKELHPFRLLLTPFFAIQSLIDRLIVYAFAAAAANAETALNLTT